MDTDEYSVLVLPEPVGPVTSTMPYGFKMLRSNFVSDSCSKPSLVMSSRRFSLSSKRMTIFSPYSVGTVETRKSSSFFFPSALYLIMMRPSCGSRFSAMSSLAMIFRRLVMASFNRSGGLITVCSRPSTRNRTRNSSSYGST